MSDELVIPARLRLAAAKHSHLIYRDKRRRPAARLMAAMQTARVLGEAVETAAAIVANAEPKT